MRLEMEKELTHEESKYSILWQDADGEIHRTETLTTQFSGCEIEVECVDEIASGAVVRLESTDNDEKWNCTVRDCKPLGQSFRAVLVRDQEAGAAGNSAGVHTPVIDDADYYDVLQISPTAEPETIHRVFRIMAARFHPDNAETGDLGKFLLLKQAYETLSDPDRRQAYDALYQSENAGPMPVFELKDFVTGVEAEANRRLGVLSLLYNQRRSDPEHPAVSLLDLERHMAFPREYLAFTI